MALKKTVTVEDLWSVPLEHNCSWLPPGSPIPAEHRNKYQSIRPIRLVSDPKGNGSIPFNWDVYLEKAYPKYLTICRSHKPWWQLGWDRKLTRWQDKLRWKLHLKLLKWGVII